MLLAEIIIATLLVSSIAFAGIFFLSKNFNLQQHDQLLKNIISLAAGALLGAAFTDLLPEAIAGNGDPGFIRNIFLVVLLSLVAFFIQEKYWHWHHCLCLDDHLAETAGNSKKSIIYTNLIGDGLHNLIDGFLIATTFMVNFQLGAITTLVVILHEIPQEISDFGILIYAGLTRAQALFYNVLFALTAVVGGIVFYFFGKNFAMTIPYMTAFAAGNFIYLAAADLIPELHHEKDPRRVLAHTSWLVIGVAVIFALNLLHEI